MNDFSIFVHKTVVLGHVFKCLSIKQLWKYLLSFNCMVTYCKDCRV